MPPSLGSPGAGPCHGSSSPLLQHRPSLQLPLRKQGLTWFLWPPETIHEVAGGSTGVAVAALGGTLSGWSARGAGRRGWGAPMRWHCRGSTTERLPAWQQHLTASPNRSAQGTPRPSQSGAANGTRMPAVVGHRGTVRAPVAPATGPPQPLSSGPSPVSSPGTDVAGGACAQEASAGGPAIPCAQ